MTLRLVVSSLIKFGPSVCSQSFFCNVDSLSLSNFFFLHTCVYFIIYRSFYNVCVLRLSHLIVFFQTATFNSDLSQWRVEFVLSMNQSMCFLLCHYI